MTWFETLTYFPEESPQQVWQNITVDGKVLKSHVNGKVMVCGQLETPSLAELRERVHSSGYEVGKISVREIVANVQDLHINKSNADSLFQVASQFNLLEMVSPNVTPERGVGIYENDPTQGRLCDRGWCRNDLSKLLCNRKWANRTINNKPNRLSCRYGSSIGKFQKPSLGNEKRLCFGIT